MSATSRYIKDFELLFVPVKTGELEERARRGGLRHCQFRSLCWRYFLHCFGDGQQCDSWLAHCQRSRQRYAEIRERHLRARQPAVKEEEEADDKKQQVQQAGPAAAGREQQGAQMSGEARRRRKEVEEEERYLRAVVHCDHKNVFKTIERDVVRTFPDMEFFKQPEVQSILSNVLYNYACEHPTVSYKQGMHELLAILLYVLHTDAHNCSINHRGGYASDTLASLLDLAHLEHDAFHLFAALMGSIESWYQNDEVLILGPAPHQRPLSSAPAAATGASGRQQVSSVLGNKLSTIAVNILRKHDLELFNHLDALQIAPQIYGIRWMRLLFGREFEFLDLLAVWDALICDRQPMALLDYVFAAMLISMRNQLVNGDYTDCLNNLMRHQFKEVPFIVGTALHLRNPHHHPRPPRPSHAHPHSHHQLTGGSATAVAEVRQRRDREPTMGSQRTRYTPKSNDDLHLIVDYCWRLLSQQIDSLQRCLPREKSLNSEDEIFVAVAQLKKVRDVLKGSLRLEDELDASATPSVAAAGAALGSGSSSRSVP